MTMRQQLRVKILRALRACDGVPMPEDALAGAVIPYVHHAGHTDVRAELVDLENENYVVSDADMLTKIKSFTLTSKGALAAKQL